MKTMFFTLFGFLLLSNTSFAKTCDGQAISAAMKEHARSGLVDPYIMTHFKVVGRTVEGSSLFTVVQLTDSNVVNYYTVEQNAQTCNVKAIN